LKTHNFLKRDYPNYTEQGKQNVQAHHITIRNSKEQYREKLLMKKIEKNLNAPLTQKTQKEGKSNNNVKDLLNNGRGECRGSGEIKPKAERESSVLWFNLES